MKIKSTWGRVFENLGRPLTLFNNYPEICIKCKAYNDEPYASSETEQEVFQWFIVCLDDFDVEWLKRSSGGVITPIWSELLGLYILPVYHCGTGWDCVDIELEFDDNEIANLENLRKHWGVEK